MIQKSRVFLSVPSHVADANAHLRHPAEQGCWVWHPYKRTTSTAILRFRLRFTLKEAIAPLIHVTADQRFQFRCNGQDITFGPDRCDLDHWTVQTLKIELLAGNHEFEVLAWYIEDVTIRGDSALGGKAINVNPPMAQMSWKAGFLLYAEGVPFSLLNTGTAPWTVEDLTDAVDMKMPIFPYYIAVGPEFTFDMKKWASNDAKPTVTVISPLLHNLHGVRRPGSSLYPCNLPEQKRAPWSGGKIRAIRKSWDESAFSMEETKASEIAQWQKLISDQIPITLPAHSQWSTIVDLENYICGYPVIQAEGGAGTLIEWKWAESLYDEKSTQVVLEGKSMKGDRGAVEDKSFFGYGDCWLIGSDPIQETPSLWWRCGRYVRIRIKTSDASLKFKGLSLVTTGYPLQFDGSWKSSDKEWDRLMPLFERAFQVSAHETWTDTPYYEQMSYVGDDTLHCLSNYAWISDIRMSRRVIQLFEWSRHASGFIAERYPSGWRQESSTFSLLWVTMIRNHTMWCDDAPFIKSIIPGMRSVLAEFDGLVQNDGLLHFVPGWPFVDWVQEWDEGKSPLTAAGCGPGIFEGDSSIVNLHWVLALLAAAQIEEAHGDSFMAQNYHKLAGTTFEKIIVRYWDKDRGILLDTVGSKAASEHAQTYALLTGLLDPEKNQSCLFALFKKEGLAPMTIYTSFYALEAMYKNGQQEEFFKRLEFWRGLLAQGFTSTPEAPEPTRSDAHAWGAHPAWHTLASIAGVRPAAPGFSRVKISPLPGHLEHFEAKIVHPKGFIEVKFSRTNNRGATFTVNLPGGISGTLVFNGKMVPLNAGKNEVSISIPASCVSFGEIWALQDRHLPGGEASCGDIA